MILNKFQFKRFILFPIIVVLSFNLYSLTNYYNNKKNIYFGIETIENYLKGIQYNHDIYIHDWIEYSTGNYEYNDHYNYISSLKELVSTEIGNKNLIFYFGSPNLVKDNIISINRKYDFVKLEHVYSLKSIYHINRSLNVINAVRLD
jgi:hypothetical protein